MTMMEMEGGQDNWRQPLHFSPPKIDGGIGNHACMEEDVPGYVDYYEHVQSTTAIPDPLPNPITFMVCHQQGL